MAYEEFQQQLQQARSQGASPREALEQLLPQVPLMRALELLRQTFALTLVDLALIYLGLQPQATLSELAVTLYEASQGSVAALELAATLTNPAVQHALSVPVNRDTLTDALNSCGYPNEDVVHAIQCLTPISIRVNADQSWQDTGIVLQEREVAHLQCGREVWKYNSQRPFCDASGCRMLVAKEGYTLPGDYEGAMVARVGDTVFPVHMGTDTPFQATGSLQLCINDDLDGQYGLGLKDNVGYITVNITVQER